MTLDEAAVVVAEPATDEAAPTADETIAATLVGAALAETESATVELLSGEQVSQVVCRRKRGKNTHAEGTTSETAAETAAEGATAEAAGDPAAEETPPPTTALWTNGKSEGQESGR